MVKIVYKHWKSGELLTAVGHLPKEWNNSGNERYVLRLEDGTFEDIIKTTVVYMEEVS